MTGSLKFFRPAECDVTGRRVGHYGFVTLDGGPEYGERDFFAHGNSFVDDPEQLERGQEVEFWLDDDPRGDGRLVAVEVRAVQHIRRDGQA